MSEEVKMPLMARLLMILTLLLFPLPLILLIPPDQNRYSFVVVMIMKISFSNFSGREKILVEMCRIDITVMWYLENWNCREGNLC